MTKVLKFKDSVWTDQAQIAFEEIKRRLTSAPVLALPNFAKIFEVECDASGVGLSLIHI